MEKRREVGRRKKRGIEIGSKGEDRADRKQIIDRKKKLENDEAKGIKKGRRKKKPDTFKGRFQKEGARWRIRASD